MHTMGSTQARAGQQPGRDQGGTPSLAWAALLCAGALGCADATPEGALGAPDDQRWRARPGSVVLERSGADRTRPEMSAPGAAQTPPHVAPTDLRQPAASEPGQQPDVDDHGVSPAPPGAEPDPTRPDYLPDDPGQQAPPPADVPTETLVACGLHFTLAAGSLEPHPEGPRVRHGLWVETPRGALYLAIPDGSSVRFARDADGQLSALDGVVRPPLPAVGAALGEAAGHLPQARLTCQQGDALMARTVPHFPLHAERTYLVFDMGAAGRVDFATFSWELTPAPWIARLLLDPTDPAYYGWGEILGMGLLVPVSKVGFGISSTGTIPYTPLSDWVAEDPSREAATRWTSFEGDLLMRGEVRALELPIAVDGELTLALDPDDDGVRGLLDDPAEPIKVGLNGALKINFPLRARLERLLQINLSLAEASAVLELGADAQGGYFSGQLINRDAWLPDFVPVFPWPDRQLDVAGAIHSDRWQDGFVEARGHFDLITADLPLPPQLSLDDLQVMDATLRADERALSLHGRVARRVHAFVEIGGGAALTLHVPWDAPERFQLSVRGDVGVSGVPLGAQASLEISRAGLFVQGVVQTPLSSVEVAGQVTDAGPQLRGRAEVTIPVSRLEEVVEQVTDATLCGTALVRDASLCGSRYVVDGAQCGFETVTDAARCGTRVVTDGARCGFHWVGRLVRLKKPKRCRVAASCQVARGCDVAQQCRVAASCTRRRQVQVSLGDFRGDVELELGVGGLAGQVRGQYCRGAGQCQTLAGGEVSFTPAPRACVDIPAAGRRCAAF